MEHELTLIECRVLGCLLEKEQTTPEYYPLTLNSLVAACNQKSNRDPVMELDEGVVEASLDGLREKKLALKLHLAGSRALKFKHDADSALWLEPPSKALLTVMLLRGPQTLGQLRTRTERMYAFPDLDAVRLIAEEMSNRPDLPLVQALPPAPGGREGRYGQILSGAIDPDEIRSTGVVAAAAVVPLEPSGLTARVAALEEEMEEAKKVIAELRQMLDDLTS
jgi:uncharacterized protein YceH (UPF0502 family)